MNLDDTPVKFGRYRGRSPEWIAMENPGYVIWMFEKVKPAPCTRQLYLAAIEAKRERDAEDDEANDQPWRE